MQTAIRACKECPAPTEPNRRRCSDCRERHRDRTRSLRAERRRGNMCPECGTQPGDHGGYCADHIPVFIHGRELRVIALEAWSADPEESCRRLLELLAQRIRRPHP